MGLPHSKHQKAHRDVAQLVAHYVRDVGVGRSSRLIPTKRQMEVAGFSVASIFVISLLLLSSFHTTKNVTKGLFISAKPNNIPDSRIARQDTRFSWNFSYSASFASQNVAKVIMKENWLPCSAASFKEIVTNTYIAKLIIGRCRRILNRKLICHAIKELIGW